MILLITVNEEHICNVAFINVISKVVSKPKVAKASRTYYKARVKLVGSDMFS
jgi:hypothetical protein